MTDAEFRRMFSRFWFLFTCPTDEEWATRWYRDPSAAWWA